ncbi:MAG: autotransporter assembly complex family protein [Paracoccaceae bacterium]
MVGALVGWSAVLTALALLSSPARALDRLDIVARGAPDGLRDALVAASLVAGAEAAGTDDAQTIFAAARADYGRIIGALYAQGYYSGVVHIQIDGREAATIAPLDAPATIRAVRITVDPGPRFTFLRARMKPYAKGTVLPPAYGDTKPAFSSAIVDAASAGVEGWRNVGHAKARVASQKIVADHATAKIDAEILLAPGPRVRFGTLNMTGYERMKPERLAKIAGFPTGEVFDPKALSTVAKRLRRTGVFRSVTMEEAETLGPGDTLDVTLTLVEQDLRRFGFGAEISSSEGLNLSGFWLHRNLFGGAERLRIDGAIENIGGQTGQIGYDLGVRIDRPATPVTDATAFIEARTSREEFVDQTIDRASFSFGLTRVLSDRLNAEAGIAYVTETATDIAGSRDYSVLALPISLTWDSRDDVVDPTKGYYLDAGLTPFYGFSSTGSGAQVTADARAYRAIGERVVLAGRFQFGSVLGTTLGQTPPNYLFYSGGGGTVRGQPFRSLGIPVARSATVSVLSGGRSFIGFSGEIRASVTDRIGAVAFYDTGFVSPGDLFSSGEWHSGAGLGLRYDTGFGPIRFDIAAPVSGTTGNGVQIYVGIGQAF